MSEDTYGLRIWPTKSLSSQVKPNFLFMFVTCYSTFQCGTILYHTWP